MSNDDQKGKRRPRDQVKVKIIGAWTASPNRLLSDRRLSRDARLLGALMFMHAGNRGLAFPSQETLAEELSHIAEVVERDPDGGTRTIQVERLISVRSVQRWLAELRRAGWLRWRQTMRCNEYTLLDPNETEACDDDSEDDDDRHDPQPPHCKVTTGATAVSPATTEGSRSNATEGSCSNATEGSSRATAESPPAIPVSPSTMLESDSLNLDSSSPDSTPARRPDDDDSTVAYLRSKGVVAAQEFRGLELAAVRERVELLERDPQLLPGGIVASLRSHPPPPVARDRYGVPLKRGGIDVSRYIGGAYGDLFRLGSDTSGLEGTGVEP